MRSHMAAELILLFLWLVAMAAIIDESQCDLLNAVFLGLDMFQTE